MNNLLRSIYWISSFSLSIVFLHSCEKEGENLIADVDGNIYTSVTIGTQIWMAENLMTTKYNDNTSIPFLTDGETWSSLTSPCYCYYNNDLSNKTTYGTLYNWYTVITGKLCPTGWHVPTYVEWTTLINFLGGEGVAGGKLKESGAVHWLSPNTGATDEFGFKALPGSFRSDTGNFGVIGSLGFWWTTTEEEASTAYLKIISSESYIITGGFGRKQIGASVRCLKDKYSTGK